MGFGVVTLQRVTSEVPRHTAVGGWGEMPPYFTNAIPSRAEE